MHVAISHLLIPGSLTPITFTVGHGNTKGQIFILNAVQVGQEAFMLLSPGVLGHLPSGLIDGIERIVGQVALCATTLAADQSHRLQLREQVLAMPIDV